MFARDAPLPTFTVRRFTCAHMLSKPSLVKVMLEALDKIPPTEWRERKTVLKVMAEVMCAKTDAVDKIEQNELVRICA